MELAVAPAEIVPPLMVSALVPFEMVPLPPSVPPLRLTAPVPSDLLPLSARTVPAEIVVAPVYVFVAVNSRTPFPVLVRPFAMPL